MAETIEQLKKELEQNNKKIVALQHQLSLYQRDATIRGFYVQNKIANQQIDILDGFDLQEEIKKNPKDDKYFDRAKSLWEGMPDMICGLNKLRVELKITGNQEKDNKNIPFIESVAETRN